MSNEKKAVKIFLINSKNEILIHPSAIVHPQATLGDGVQIGPFSVIGEKVSVAKNTRKNLWPRHRQQPEQFYDRVPVAAVESVQPFGLDMQEE